MSSNDDALKRMSKLVNSLLGRVDCGPFREPVDWEGLELWDYPKIITKMMDLGTVKRKLDKGVYKTAADCAEDIRLIWKNCKTYNADGSDFYLLAESFSKRFEERYKKIRAEFANLEDGKWSQSKGDKGGPLSLDTKTRFASHLFKLSGKELGHVMQVLDLRCPQALEQPDDENCGEKGLATQIEINVDAIDSRTFFELEKYVNEKVGAQSLDPLPLMGDISYGETLNSSNKKRKK